MKKFLKISKNCAVIFHVLMVAFNIHFSLSEDFFEKLTWSSMVCEMFMITLRDELSV